MTAKVKRGDRISDHSFDRQSIDCGVRLYDTSRHVLTTTRLADTPDAVTTTFTFEPTFFQLASVTDPLYHTWTVTYDGSGRLTGSTDPLSHQTGTTLAASGLVTAQEKCD